MTKEVILTVIRQILLSLGSVVVAQGMIDDATVQAIIGGLLAVVAVVWGIFSKTKDVAKVEAAKTVLSAADPGVTKTDVAVAAARIEGK